MSKPWGRLEQGYVRHPKFVALSDGAFRLWHEGKSYCDEYLTDGRIPRGALGTFSRYTEAHAAELMASCGAKPDGTPYAPLWVANGDGTEMHDYRDHNESAAVTQRRIRKADQRRKKDRERLRRWRAERERAEETPPETPKETPEETPPETRRATGRKTRRYAGKQIQKQKQKQVLLPVDRATFDAFWAIFPNHDGQKPAEDWWADIRPDGGLLDRIMRGAERYARYVRALDRKTPYVKAAVNWLEERHFDDAYELPPAPVARGVSGTNCPHTPACRTTQACIDRIIAEGRAERAAQAAV